MDGPPTSPDNAKPGYTLRACSRGTNALMPDTRSSKGVAKPLDSRAVEVLCAPRNDVVTFAPDARSHRTTMIAGNIAATQMSTTAAERSRGFVSRPVTANRRLQRTIVTTSEAFEVVTATSPNALTASSSND